VVKSFNIETCRIEASKHFKNTWMRKWGWDYQDLRDAVRDSYRIQKAGKRKLEAYVRKKGEKKMIMAYQWEHDTLFIITGTEG
jgi:hypothetical protein